MTTAKRKPDRASDLMVRPAGAAAAAGGEQPREAIKVPVIMHDGSIADMVNMTASDIDWRHVAETLSKVPRFNGRHPGGAISIAQHQVMGADAIFNETGDAVPAGYFLVHDVHEHPFGDIGRPSALTIDHYVEQILLQRGVTAEIARGVGKQAIERAKAHIDVAVHQAAGLPPLSGMPAYRRIVRDMDERMCFAEAKALYGVTRPIPLVACDLPPPRTTGAIRPWGPVKAEIAYLDRLERYLGIVARVS
jgi:hypothetical protein